MDITADDYTELEWCLKATDEAQYDDVYQFRVTANGTPLTTYSATPQWTIQAGGFPTVQATNTTTIDTATLNHSVNLPTGIQAGDLLIVGFTTFYDVSHTFPVGWTELFSDVVASNNTRTSIYYRQADGAEGSTITVTTGAGALSSSVA